MTDVDIHQEFIELKRYVYGNGEAGLGERVRLLEGMAMSIRRGMRLFALAIFGLFANLAWEIVSYYLKTQT